MSSRAPTRTQAPGRRRQAPVSGRSSPLRTVERVFESAGFADRRALNRARNQARARWAALGEVSGDTGAASLALVAAAAELLCAVAAEIDRDAGLAEQVVVELEQTAGIDRLELAVAALRSPDLLTLAPPRAVRNQLAMLIALAPLRGASLWTRGAAGRVECVHGVGEAPSARGARELAAALLSGERRDGSPRSMFVGRAIGSTEQPLAAIVGLTAPSCRRRCEILIAEAAPMLMAILEREALLTNNSEVERSLTESSERKLTRLGFDLHDGPLQDMAVLAEDLRLFRDQLQAAESLGTDSELVQGRFEDLEAQLQSVDADLRRLSNEVNSASVLLNRPFRSALEDRVKAFVVRTGLEPRLKLSGDLGLISTSQQIALLNIVHESLNNIRDHAGAAQVTIELSVTGQRVELAVTDDGRGFDLEATLMRAAREGRVGLLGMHERIRLLGGQCRIDTATGGPTKISVSLDVWQPLLPSANATERASG